MLWPFAINWESRVLLRLEWLNQVQLSKNDTELVTQLRTGARRTLRFETLVGTDAERVQYENILIAGQADEYQLPWWPQQVWVTAPIADTDTVIAVTDTTRRDLAPGAQVAVVNELRAVLATVDSLTTNSVTLTAAVGEWPVGTKVVPVFDARIQSQQRLRYLTDAIMTAEVEFRATDEWVGTPADEADDYRGYPVLLPQSDWSEDLSVEISRAMAVFDNQTGVINYIDQADFSRSTRSHRFVVAGIDQLGELFNWLAARKGRYTPLWLPSNQNDFAVRNSISSGAITITVDNWRHADVVGEPGRQDIMIKLRDGTLFYRRIEDVEVLDADSERLTIDSALGVAVTPADIDIVSYLRFVRLASDAVEVAYENDLLALVAVSFVGKREVA